MSLPPISDLSMDCVFCKIVSRDIPAEVLYDGEKIMAILDLHPIHPGHALILPKAHFRDLLNLPAGIFQELMQVTQTVAGALVRSQNLQGFNIFSNNGAVAGQSVFHFHIHITPRFDGDMVRFVHGLKSYAEGEMAKCAARIRDSIHSKE